MNTCAPSCSKKVRPDIAADNCVCPLCSKPWLSMDHRLCSLRCGHLFGKSCIKSFVAKNRRCPICDKRASVGGIRNIHATHLETLDTNDVKYVVDDLRLKSEKLRKDCQKLQNINSIWEEKIADLRDDNNDLLNEITQRTVLATVVSEILETEIVSLE